MKKPSSARALDMVRGLKSALSSPNDGERATYLLQMLEAELIQLSAGENENGKEAHTTTD